MIIPPSILNKAASLTHVELKQVLSDSGYKPAHGEAVESKFVGMNSESRPAWIYEIVDSGVNGDKSELRFNVYVTVTFQVVGLADQRIWVFRADY